MKKLFKCAIVAAMLGSTATANAQYYAIADRLANMITPAIYGGLNYKGLVEVSAIKGIGENNGDFVGISTTQGFKYADWFFMGVGLGVDLLMTHVDNYNFEHETITKTGCVIPLFTDFRFNFGNQSYVSYFIGAKVGCSFLVGNNDISVNRGYITSSECFYLKPSIGVRIPAGSGDRTAVTIAASYQLITPGYRQYNYYNNQSISLNGLGVTLGFEW